MIRDRIGLGMGLVCALFAGTLSAVGCQQGSGPEEELGDTPAQIVELICEQQCACTSCGESSMQDCMDGGFQRRDEANAAGCSAEWITFVDCLYAHPVCEDGLVQVGQCGDELAANDACIAKM